MFFHVSLDSNHRISIPNQIRKQINLKKGDSLIMTLINNEIHLNSIDKNIVAAQKLVKQYCENNNLVDKLFQMRKEETKQEAQKQNITENQIPTGK
jgi:AbrB family looped-hinge helix DNA binding protein